MFDLPSAQNLVRIQDDIKNCLGLSSEEGVRCYKSLSSALFECTFSTLQFYSHRKTVVLHRGVSPFIQQLEAPLIRDSKNVVSVQLEPAALEKDTALVVISADHIVTGQSYSIEDIEEMANQSRIVSLKILHSQELVIASLQREIQPYSIELLNVGHGQTLARLGKKCKIHSFFSHLEPTSVFGSEFLEILKSKPKSQSPHFQVAQDRLIPSGWEFFPSEKMGACRSLISHSQLNSEMVLQQLRGRLPALTEAFCESTSLCRWNAGQGFYDWWEGRPSDSFLRGGLVLHSSCFDVPGFVDVLIELSASPEFVL